MLILVFNFIGGQDFDAIIMNYALREYMESSNNDVFGNKRLINRLRTECRKAKEAFSFNASSYSIHVSIIRLIELVNFIIQLDINQGDHLDLNVELTKEKFNELCKEFYSKTINLIDDTLRMAKFSTDDIDHVVNNHENPSILIENIFLE